MPCRKVWVKAQRGRLRTRARLISLSALRSHPGCEALGVATKPRRLGKSAVSIQVRIQYRSRARIRGGGCSEICQFALAAGRGQTVDADRCLRCGRTGVFHGTRSETSGCQVAEPECPVAAEGRVEGGCRRRRRRPSGVAPRRLAPGRLPVRDRPACPAPRPPLSRGSSTRLPTRRWPPATRRCAARCLLRRRWSRRPADHARSCDRPNNGSIG